MTRLRTLAAALLTLFVLAAFSWSAQSDPATGVRVATSEELNALADRVTALETKPTPTPTPEPSPDPTPEPTPEPSPEPSPTPTPTPTPEPSPSPSTPATSWPTEANTGVPAGTVLTAYSGPSRITTAGTVIDGKRINGSLTIAAPNVTVKRSSVDSISVESGSLLVQDTTISLGNRSGTQLGEINYVAERIKILGGNRGAHCYNNCTIRDSYVHGGFTDPSGKFHMSGVRMGRNGNFIGNTIACNAPDIGDAGCSAPFTGYGDFSAIENNLIQGNYFPRTTGGTCVYGGSSGGKPYSNAANNIRFIDNVFERRTDSEKGNTCGYYFTVADFNPGAPGNVWRGNKYDDGSTVNP